MNRHEALRNYDNAWQEYERATAAFEVARLSMENASHAFSLAKSNLREAERATIPEKFIPKLI